MRRHVVVFAVIVLAACSRQPSDGILAHGTIEVIETDVSPMATARLLRIPVEEGDAVRPGDTLAILTQATLAATLDGQRARLASAEAALRDLERGARAGVNAWLRKPCTSEQMIAVVSEFARSPDTASGA